MLRRCKYNCLNNTNLGHRWWLYQLSQSNIHLLWWSELLKSFTKNSVKQKLVISFQAGYQPFHGKSSFLGDRAERSTWPPFTDADCKKHTDWETLSSRPMIKAHVFQNVKHLFTDKTRNQNSLTLRLWFCFPKKKNPISICTVATHFEKIHTLKVLS